MSSIEEVLKVAKNATSRRAQIDSVYQVNMAVLDELIVEIKKLHIAGQLDVAKKLINIAQTILDNNNRYRDLIEEIMKDVESR